MCNISIRILCAFTIHHLSIQDALIDGILKDDFVGEDFSAALSILQEFLTIGTSPLDIRDMLLILGQLYKDIQRQEETVLGILGFDMRKVNILHKFRTV